MPISNETEWSPLQEDLDVCVGSGPCEEPACAVHPATCPPWGDPAACRQCAWAGTITVRIGPLRTHERGCAHCAAGARFEASLRRMDSAQRERDLDATGQDQEAFDGPEA